MKVAFQGVEGAYSHLAARAIFGVDAQFVPSGSFDHVFERVEQGEADYGVVPVENTVAGTIHRTYDLLLHSSLSIVGEYSQQVQHCLIAMPNVSLDEVKVVISHPQALAQCERNLRELGLNPEAGTNTAGSVKAIAESGRRDAAALASRFAAETYGMNVLREGMQDHPHNFTRFVRLCPSPLQPSEADAGPIKASVAFSLKNEPGALFKALAVFTLRDIDLTKLESRPIPGTAWEYMFYLDFVTDDFQGKGSRALEHLQEICTMFKLLGAYRRQDQTAVA